MIKFKGYDLTSKGIIVENIPKIQKAKKRIDIYDIYGRNGFLSVDNGTYDSWQLSVECHCADNIDVNEIATFLDGYGTISFDDIKQSTAIVNSNIEFEKIRNSGFKKFLLSFLINPIFEDIIPTHTEELSNEFEQVGDFNVLTYTTTTYSKIYPILEIELASDTDFYFNNKKFSLKSGTYILDCKNKEITNSMGENMSSKMSGNFPYLGKTTEIKVNNIPTSFKMIYSNTYLVG